MIDTVQLMFSQVREDAEIEIGLLQTLPRGSRFVCVSSGGCLLLNILSAVQNLTKVDVVDINPVQLELAKHKLDVIQRLPAEDARAALAAINQAGRFEKLFAARTIENHDELFSNANLTAVFGEKATQSGMDYATHFHRVYQEAARGENQFHEQLLYGEYREHYPRYLSLSAPLQINQNITWHQADLVQFVKRMENESVDLLHLSNVFDWTPEAEWIDVFREVRRVLAPGGYATIRSLGDRLRCYCQTYPGYVFRGESDASGFYQTVCTLHRASQVF